MMGIGNATGTPFIRGKVYIYIVDNNRCYVTDELGRKIVLN